jgi:very-short-patch-repair endonuclease
LAVGNCTQHKGLDSGSPIENGGEVGPDRRLDEYAARQYGVFSLKQARTAGLSERMVEHRIRTGAWIRMSGGVYALASSPPTWERQLSATVLSRPGSVVAGASAASLHGFEGFGQGRPVVMVPIDGNARSPIARIIRSRYFYEIERKRVGPFLATSPAETLVTLASGVSGQRLEHLLDECVVSRLVDPEAFMTLLARRSGLKGLPALRRITADRLESAYQPPTSVLERHLYTLLSRPGIPKVIRQFPFPREVVPGTVDAYIPLWRLITEADGRRWHTRQADFERDRTRDNLATSHGIGVLRFTYQMLVRQPEQCLSTILATGRTRSQAS